MVLRYPRGRMLALLYHVQILRVNSKRVEITLVPNWLGRWLRRRTRAGEAFASECTSLADTKLHWWWSATRRHVGGHIQGYIEAAPVDLDLIARIRDLDLIEPAPGWEDRAVERWRREAKPRR